MFLVLLETSGNQNYIFSTNKLKENIGASELTYQAGTKWVLNAVAEVNGTNYLSLWTNEGSGQLRSKLLDSKLNPAIEESDVKVEVIIAVSGKALLLAKEEKDARTIIRQVTQQALVEAPGLDICGVSHQFDWKQPKSLSQAIRLIYQKSELVRSQKPSTIQRFLRLPVIEDCATSGLPAARLDKDNKAISLVSHVKRQLNLDGFQRIESLLRKEYPDLNFSQSIKVLNEEFNLNREKNLLADLSENKSTSTNNSDRAIEWLAVIHADGNGLGEIFLNFDRHLEALIKTTNTNIEETEFNRFYVNNLRQFSLDLDGCTERAFLSALEVFQPKKNKLLPIVPLILGGDDLTVVCDGKLALPFTEAFLKAFERETANQTTENTIIPQIAQLALQASRLSACGGIAVIKPHFPFSIAYELAEALTKSAKKVKEIVTIADTTVQQQSNNKKKIPYPCSALDFHIVYDSSGVELNQIRRKLEIDEGKTKLYCRPYIVTPKDDLQPAQRKEWVELHHWELLTKWVKVLGAKDEKTNRRKLPNNQIRQLRSGLFLGRELADARYQLIRERYMQKGIKELEGSEASLFVIEPKEKEIDRSSQETTETYITGLLDAIKAADFLGQGAEINGKK